MTQSISFSIQLLLQLIKTYVNTHTTATHFDNYRLANGAGFDLHRHIVVIDPQHAIHRFHIERNNHTFLILRT
jgi:hypothetical protein